MIRVDDLHMHFGGLRAVDGASLEIAEGELFSETGLERSRRRIAALGYFERVDVSTEQTDDSEVIDVNIEVQEKPTGTFQIGAGFSSIERTFPVSSKSTTP